MLEDDSRGVVYTHFTRVGGGTQCRVKAMLGLMELA